MLIGVKDWELQENKTGTRQLRPCPCLCCLKTYPPPTTHALSFSRAHKNEQRRTVRRQVMGRDGVLWRGNASSTRPVKYVQALL